MKTSRSARRKSSYLRTVRKLPWLDQAAFLLAGLLGVMVAVALSPIVLPLWVLALIKKLVGPAQAEETPKEPEEIPQMHALGLTYRGR